MRRRFARVSIAVVGEFKKQEARLPNNCYSNTIEHTVLTCGPHDRIL